MEPYMSVRAESAERLAKSSDRSEDAVEIARKVVYNAWLTMEVKNPDSANVRFQSVAKRYGGYAQELGTTRAVIRVESDRLEEAITSLAGVGELTDRRLSGKDVTDEYLDLEIRLENAQKSRDRYLELLEQAENVEAALKVERELERLNGQIDLYKGRMKRLTHLSNFATITIRIQEKVETDEPKPGILGYIGIGLYRGVKWLFVRG